MEDSKMKKHVTVVGAIHIGISILGFIGTGACFFALNYVKEFVGDDEIATKVLRIISVIVPVLLLVLSTLVLVGGIGIIKYKSWARYLIIVTVILGLLSNLMSFFSIFISFGENRTLIIGFILIYSTISVLTGVYCLWVLLQNETIKLFETR